MISILAQERLLGAVLGCAVTGIIVFEQRKCIHKSIGYDQSQVGSKSETRDPIFAKKKRSEFAQLWNKSVDQTFGPVIASLSSRKW